MCILESHMCPCVSYIVSTVHNCCVDNNKPLQMFKCLVAQCKHVAIFCLPCTGGDTVIQLYHCIYLCWAKCQWSLNEVQDGVPDQQMLYNLKRPRASTAVFTEKEWAELAVYSWPCMSVVVMCIVCICVTVFLVWYDDYKLAWVRTRFLRQSDPCHWLCCAGV